MKTFHQYLKEGNASDFSYAPDTMGEDITMPGGSMFDASRLAVESTPTIDLVDAPELEAPDQDPDKEPIFEHLAHVNGKWALVSKKTGRPLRYFHGPGKPSSDWVSNAERSVQYWKHHG